MKGKCKNRRGQAIVMVTLSLFVICGILGLAVDLGWSFFIKKSAQAAADSAALAAAGYVYHTYGSGPFATCPAGAVCGQLTPAPCPGSKNLQNGCLYAQQNGFTAGGAGGNQNVTMAADISSPAPTVPNVQVSYWVTARSSQGIPHLFASVLGNTFGISAARATAALAQIIYPGTIYALNRQNDTSPCGTPGVSICTNGAANINAPGGSVFIASNVADAGQADVTAALTLVRSPGTASWGSTSAPDGPQFQDPFSGKGQPPLPTLPLVGNSYAVTGASLDCSNPIRQGYYYAVDNKGVPTGAPISASGSCTFGNSGVFNQFVFFGGLSLSGGTLTFNPGEYILAGACPGCAGGSSSVLYMDKYNVADAGTASAGEIFIFTDGHYTGLAVPQTLLNAPAVYGQLGFGTVDLHGGNGNTGGTLNGLNPGNGLLPASFDKFAPVVWWTDQRSSPVLYNALGNVVTTGPCTTETGGTPSLDNPCKNANGQVPGPGIYFQQSHPNLGLNGTLYQPRGGFIDGIHGHGDLTGNTQIITGAINLQSGGSNLDPIGVTNPPKGIVVTLIE